MASEPPPLEYLLDRSRSGLKNLLNIKQNRSANLRKQIMQIAEQWAEEKALELLTEWFILYGEKLVELAASSASPEEAPKKLIKAEPESRFHDSLTKPYRYEFWRSEQRHNRRNGAR
jgi:hypothetical protein